ncbi:hypothetical protein PV08_01508 [Exophiala spinifera]|uniref:Uncharacterized protein n=1 Tax=Exophiala spinifera TaxID=91928 RepID=A0A0D2CBP2_9EURO|nr:uncharacterized protein PV08_01508 [Exophiala spinifera]KIW20929.1 hypothetical protein PV08_01508 [Exophiala spinifera]
MTSIIFINVQDVSDHSKARARQHAATVYHRRKRLTGCRHYQKASRSRTDGDADLVKDEPVSQGRMMVTRRRPDLTSTMSTAPERPRIDNAGVSAPPWRCTAPTTIKSVADDLKIEAVLRISLDWMVGQYNCRWSSLMEHDSGLLDMDNKLELFRETFYIVSDLLDLNKVNAAFAVLKVTLDTFPRLLQEIHPELLFSLAELAYGLSMPNSSALHSKIKTHVAEMTSLILGSDHPFTILLNMEFVGELRSHVTEVVFKCITDSLGRTFGKTAYQTLVHQFGRSQFYARTGQVEEGKKIMGQVLDTWKCLYGPDSILARLAELEYNLLGLQRQRLHDLSLDAQISNIMCRIESISGICNNKFTDQSPSNFQGIERASGKLRLARWFLQNKRYTFALHCYDRSTLRSGADSSQAISSLADTISNIVETSFKDGSTQIEGGYIVPSQAPIDTSVATMTQTQF